MFCNVFCRFCFPDYPLVQSINMACLNKLIVAAECPSESHWDYSVPTEFIIQMAISHLYFYCICIARKKLEF